MQYVKGVANVSVCTGAWLMEGSNDGGVLPHLAAECTPLRKNIT